MRVWVPVWVRVWVQVRVWIYSGMFGYIGVIWEAIPEENSPLKESGGGGAWGGGSISRDVQFGEWGDKSFE